jgi:hypothetical protein
VAVPGVAAGHGFRGYLFMAAIRLFAEVCGRGIMAVAADTLIGTCRFFVRGVVHMDMDGWDLLAGRSR